MLNIIDYFYCRILRILLGKKRKDRAASTLAYAFACLTLFIPFNLSYFLFRNDIAIIVTLILYMIGIFWLFERRYSRYGNDAEKRFKFIRKYSSYRMNKLIPDWAIIIGIYLTCGFGLFFAFISNNLLRDNEMSFYFFGM